MPCSRKYAPPPFREMASSYAARWSSFCAGRLSGHGDKLTNKGNSLIETKGSVMSPLLIIIAIVAVILLLTGGFVPSLQFLLWVGIVILVIAVIMFLLRSNTGRKGL